MKIEINVYIDIDIQCRCCGNHHARLRFYRNPDNQSDRLLAVCPVNGQALRVRWIALEAPLQPARRPRRRFVL